MLEIQPSAGQFTVAAPEYHTAHAKSRWIALIIVWIFSALYVWQFVDRGWIAHDDGSMAQMAERVLKGELPHRDFDEIYTGGLSLLYAGAFKLFGINLITIRVVLFVFFLAFVPAVYAIALRFSGPALAAAVTLVSVVWSVPNYFAGLPSWYNLFFAIWGTLAIIRYLETQRPRCLFVAGLCGGLSFLAKMAGLYFLAAVFLFLMYREHVVNGETRSPKRIVSPFSLFKILIYLAFLTGVTGLLWPRLGFAEGVNLLLPIAAITGMLIWTEWIDQRGTFGARFPTLFRLSIPFCLGAAIPVVLFLVPYVLSHSVGDWYRGVFVLSHKRLQYASTPFPSFLTVIAAIPYGFLLFVPVAANNKARVNKILAAGLVLILALGLLFSGNVFTYEFIWHSARWLSVVAVLAGCLLVTRAAQSGELPRRQSELLVLLLIACALVMLVQFPFPAPIYFCYIAPFVVLVLLATVTAQYDLPKLPHIAILVFYFLFAVLALNRTYVTYYRVYQPTGRIENPRGGILTATEERDYYAKLIETIRDHARSDFIYATPDCPEVYFLSGRRNPTRKIFDFLSEIHEDGVYTENLVETKKINLVVINRTPSHSPPPAADVDKIFRNRFPQSADIGPFTVRWME